MSDLDDRLKRIEERLQVMERRLEIKNLSPKAPEAQAIPIQKLKEQQSSPMVVWLKSNWLICIGMLLVVLAGGWFVNLAFKNDWVNETTRVFICLASGIGMYGLGIWLLKQYSRAAQTLLILGMSLTILAFYSGSKQYQFIPEGLAFACSVGCAALTAWMAIKENLAGAGFASILMAMLIPLLFTHSNQIFNYSYILLIDVIALGMFLMRGWSWPFTLAWLATLIYSFDLVLIKNDVAVNFYVAAFFLLFYVAAACCVCGLIDRKLPLKGAVLLVTATLALLGWVHYFVEYPWDIIYCSAAALLAFFFGYMMSVRWEKIQGATENWKYGLATVLGVSTMLFLFVATLLVNKHFISDRIILFSLEGVAAIAIGYYVLRAPAAAAGLSYYLLIPLYWLGLKYPDVLYVPFSSEDFSALCVTLGAFGLSTWIMRKSQKDSFERTIFCGLGILTSVLFMGLIWNLCHNLIPSGNIARGVALVIYILVAEALIFMGNRRQMKYLRWAGSAVLIFVTCRLLLVEAWKMPIIVRTITFVVVGLMIMGTAFLDKKSKV